MIMRMAAALESDAVTGIAGAPMVYTSDARQGAVIGKGQQ